MNIRNSSSFASPGCTKLPQSFWEPAARPDGPGSSLDLFARVGAADALQMPKSDVTAGVNLAGM